jgi:hypothetical protein
VFNVGGHITTISKSAGVFQYSNDGLSRLPFAVRSNEPGGPPGSLLAKVIEPGYSYYLRLWRPDNNNSYSKVWEEAGGDEPSDWQSFGGSNPPYAWDIYGNLIEWPAGKPTDTTLTNQTITISAQIFTMTQYSLHIDGIYACQETADDVEIPFIKPSLPSGSDYTEHFSSVTSTYGVHTIVPYVPRSLILSVNGIMQRKGVDYVEADPVKGTFTLLFTPDAGDKVTVRYYVA